MPALAPREDWKRKEPGTLFGRVKANGRVVDLGRDSGDLSRAVGILREQGIDLAGALSQTAHGLHIGYLVADGIGVGIEHCLSLRAYLTFSEFTAISPIP